MVASESDAQPRQQSRWLLKGELIDQEDPPAQGLTKFKLSVDVNSPVSGNPCSRTICTYWSALPGLSVRHHLSAPFKLQVLLC